MSAEAPQQTPEPTEESEQAAVFDGARTVGEATLAAAILEKRGGVHIPLPEHLRILSPDLLDVMGRHTGPEAIISYVDSDREQNGGRPLQIFRRYPL